MKDLVETLQQISLGLFVNGSYGIMQGDFNWKNNLIVIITIKAMYFANRIKRSL
jgi:hypothetical protein